MSLHGNGRVPKEIFCDYYYDHGLDSDYHSVKKKRVDFVKRTFRLHDNEKVEIQTRIQRDALYDPTIETNHVNDFNFRYYPNGFHYFGKMPRTYEFSEYIHRCYYGDLTVVCVLIDDENDKYDIANHKLDYISENKLRWFFT